jgi:hypothetical protein
MAFSRPLASSRVSQADPLPDKSPISAPNDAPRYAGAHREDRKTRERHPAAGRMARSNFAPRLPYAAFSRDRGAEADQPAQPKETPVSVREPRTYFIDSDVVLQQMA